MTSTPADQTVEGRQAPRERTFLPARIAFGEHGALSTPCTVTQLSSTGARVNVPANTTLPDRFELSIPQRSLTTRVRLVWRRGDLIGVQFDEHAEEPAASSEDLQARIRELEAANAKLRARVAELTEQVHRLTEI
jgi:hypothetical protein